MTIYTDHFKDVECNTYQQFFIIPLNDIPYDKEDYYEINFRKKLYYEKFI